MNPTPPQSSSEAIPPEDSISHYYRHSIKELRRDPAFGPGGSHFGGVVHHFLPLVYGTALKLLPEHPESAPRISQAVFELLSIKWRSLLKGRTVTGWVPSLFLWLLRATVSVSLRERKRLRLRKPARKSSAADHLALFRRFFRLSKKSQRGVLIFHILRLPSVSDYPRLDAHRKHAAKAVRTLSRKLRKTSLGPDIDAALAALVAPVPPEIESAVLDSAQRWTVKAPRQDLTRATLLNWRLLALGTFFKRVLATIGFIACLVVTFVLLAQFGYLNDFFFAMGRKETLKNFPELALLARPWPVTDEDQALVRTELPRSSADLYQATNIWIARLSFKEGDWDEIQPVRVPPVRNMFQDGRIILRNPKAERSGLSGVLGYHFNWVEAQFQFAGAWFTNVAARYRGNGTFIQSLYGPKQSFKIDLNKYTKKQALAGIDELNFVNSIPDSSYVHDALAHRLFRDLGALGPRTAYAFLSIDVPGKWTNQPIGLYNLIENIDKDFADDRFGTKKVPIFKPVTYELFQDLGAHWTNYADIYDLKTDATPAQLQRVVELAQLTSHASDEEFARRLPDFLDLEEFAAFVSGHVLLSSYDGFFSNGQNYFLYLHPESNRFGFISWDQDHSWGEFGYIGTAEQREQASIWKPWIARYDFRFLKRTMEVPAFREIYRSKLESALETLFTIDRLYAQVDQLAALIRPAVAAESDFRLRRFDKAVTSEFDESPRAEAGRPAEGPNSPVHQIKRFIENRIKSIRAQLDGTDEGVQLGQRY